LELEELLVHQEDVMSNRIHLDRARRGGLALAAGLALVGTPPSAQAAPVDLGSAGAFVVLGGQTVTNVGSSVLNGDLGLAPGTAMTGFGTAVVNGAQHVADTVAQRAQLDLATAYDVAAREPVTQDLTGIDLGDMTLKAGVYRYSSSAGLTKTLVLDAENDPEAHFVFQIGSTLTTASASRVVLVNGASACNVFWQVTSSATLGTGTVFKGNVLALTSITLNAGVSLTGRLLARNGSVTLDHGVLDRSTCDTGSTPAQLAATPTVSPTRSPTGGPTGTSPTTPAGGSPTSRGDTTSTVTRHGTTTLTRAPAGCDDGFRAVVRGKMIKRVVFSLDGRRLVSRISAPFGVFVRASPGSHRVSARVTFKDATRPRTLTLRYRACASAVLRPLPGPSRFTG
jgi:ice-binding like protein